MFRRLIDPLRSPTRPLSRATAVALTVGSLVLLPGPGAVQAQDDDGIRRTERNEPIPVERLLFDRGPIDHVGWGTLEDLHVDLGAGAAVSVFSGNLIVSVTTFHRGDAVPDSRLALTYNHIDSDGSPELGPGWSLDIGRFWAPGPWGERVLIDADGFRDSFVAGKPPDLSTAREALDEVARAWKRATPRPERQAMGGSEAFRSMLASDPLFFGEMRTRYLGPAPPHPDHDTWVSQRRGTRALRDSEDKNETTLDRPDGGTELYDRDGNLLEVRPGYGPFIRLDRSGGVANNVEVGGQLEFQLDRDSWGRIRRIRASNGEVAEFEYAGRYLHRLDLPGGVVRFRYDEGGRLVEMESPLGRVGAIYDPASERVATASGPHGSVRLSDLDEAGGAQRVTVRGAGSQPLRASWSPSKLERIVEQGERRESVVFHPDQTLPVRVRNANGDLELEWDDAGRLLSAERGEVKTTWERGDGGRLDALVDRGRATARMVQGGDGVLAGWLDPEDRRTSLSFDDLGLPAIVARSGGLREIIGRSRTGSLRTVEVEGGESLTLRRDPRGYVRTVESFGAGTIGLQIDNLGRIRRYEGPHGLIATLEWTGPDSLVRLGDGRGNVDLHFSSGLRLAGWRGAWDQYALRRDADGRPEALEQRGRAAWRLSRDEAGRVSELELGPQRRLDLVLDSAGRLLGWNDPLHGERRFGIDRKGHVDSWRDPLAGDVSLDLDAWSRVTSVRRGTAGWSLERDRTGRVTRIVDPVGAETRIQLDGGGRAQTLDSAEGLRWTASHDPLGRLLRLQERTQQWSMRYDRVGHPVLFEGPSEGEATIRWDRSGRWAELVRPGRARLGARYSAYGPTRVGDTRRHYGRQGEVDGWGPADQDGGWSVDRVADGRPRSITWTAGQRSTQRWSRSLLRDGAGRLQRMGPWTFRWRDGLLTEASHSVDDAEPTAWGLRWDDEGRVEALTAPDGRTATRRLDPLGDVRTLLVQHPGESDASWVIGRDSAARIARVDRDGGGSWRLLRDGLGRVNRWDVEEPGGRPWKLHFEPLDGTTLEGDGMLAAALGVQVEEPAARASKPSGSRRLRLSTPSEGTVLEIDELRDDWGNYAAAEGFWGSTGLPGKGLRFEPAPGAAPQRNTTGSAAPVAGADPIADALTAGLSGRDGDGDGDDDGDGDGAGDGDDDRSEGRDGYDDGDDAVAAALFGQGPPAPGQTESIGGGSPASGSSVAAAGGAASSSADGDPLVDLIALALTPPRLPLFWGAAPLSGSHGAALLPSPVARGAGATAAGWVRLPLADGGTGSWVGPGARLTGLRLPGPAGLWMLPDGWPEAVLPPDATPPEDSGAATPSARPGLTAGVDWWWSRFEIQWDSLARMPLGGAGSARAWRRPREAARSLDALLPPDTAPTGVGSLLPEMPGTERLRPGAAGVVVVSPMTALVLSRDLPPASADHRRFVALPAPVWTVEVPGADLLAELVERRSWPAAPPGWRADPVAGLSPGMAGLLSAHAPAWDLQQPWDLSPAVSGLPAGISELLPGGPGVLPGAAPSLPVHGRATAFDALGDHPLVPGAQRRHLAEADAVQLFVRDRMPRPPGAMSGWVGAPVDRGGWVIETPTGVRAIVDDRGRLLSIDLAGRLHDAFARSAAAHAARSLLYVPPYDLPEAAWLESPRWLPEPSSLPESRWGLVPGNPELPLRGDGTPGLHRVVDPDPSPGRR